MTAELRFRTVICMSKWDDNRPAFGTGTVLVVLFVVAPAALAAAVLGALALLTSVRVPWGTVVPTAIVLLAIWLATGAIVREIRRK